MGIYDYDTKKLSKKVKISQKSFSAYGLTVKKYGFTDYDTLQIVVERKEDYPDKIKIKEMGVAAVVCEKNIILCSEIQRVCGIEDNENVLMEFCFYTDVDWDIVTSIQIMLQYLQRNDIDEIKRKESNSDLKGRTEVVDETFKRNHIKCEKVSYNVEGTFGLEVLMELSLIGDCDSEYNTINIVFYDKEDEIMSVINKSFVDVRKTINTVVSIDTHKRNIANVGRIVINMDENLRHFSEE